MSFTFVALLGFAVVGAVGRPFGGVCAMGVAPGSGVEGLDAAALKGVADGVTFKGNAEAGMKGHWQGGRRT